MDMTDAEYATYLEHVARIKAAARKARDLIDAELARIAELEARRAAARN